jgi:hypothetical protein
VKLLGHSLAAAALVAALGAASGSASATTIGISANPVTGSGVLIATPGTVSLGTAVNTYLETGADPSDPFGWDPWGSSDTTSDWLSVAGCCGGAGSYQDLTISEPVNTLSLLWGSPNADNTITLSNGSVISYVDNASSSSLDGFYINGVLQAGTSLPNTMDPGYIVTISSSTFTSAVLTNTIGGFEVADISAGSISTDVSSAPLPSTWIMLLSGFIGLGFFAYRGAKKNSQAVKMF